MGIWGKLFGDREPSAEREQRAAEEQAMGQEEAPARENEVRGEKRFAAVLRSPKREGEPPRLEMDWEIVKIDDQTGEVTVRKEGVGKKTLRHEQFWALNFPKSGEMIDELEDERKKVTEWTLAGSETQIRRQEKELAYFDQIKEAFKAGELNPMREYFAESLADLQREAVAAEKNRAEQREKFAADIEEQDKYLERLTRQFASEKSQKRKILLKDEMGKVEDWKRALSIKLGKLNGPSPTNPELERVRGLVQILDQEINAREKKVA